MENGSTFLETPNYLLRTLTAADVDGNYLHWLNDAEVVRYNSHGRFPQTAETLKNYVQSVSQQTGQLVLAVVDRASGQHIGNISLQQISWVDRSAEIAFLLGEKDFRGKGVMFEAGAKLIEHAFRTLNLHRVYCGTSSENQAMRKLALKLGMAQEGVRKEAIFNGGNYHDLIEFGIINHD
jgi:[ribosomal protein S5]-alanine N-acetyltransferase